MSAILLSVDSSQGLTNPEDSSGNHILYLWCIPIQLFGSESGAKSGFDRDPSSLSKHPEIVSEVSRLWPTLELVKKVD